MKKYILIGAIVLVVLAGGGGYWYFAGAKDEVSPLAQNVVAEPTAAPEELATWEDQSDFAIQYPKSLKLNPHEEDQQNYAHLELTSEAHPGRIIIWAKDTKAKTIEDWVKQQKITGALDTNLGGQLAKKSLTQGETTEITTTAIYNGYLYQIELKPIDAEYWNGVHDTILKSFTFSPKEAKVQEESAVSNSNPGPASAYEEVTADEEEVIE